MIHIYTGEGKGKTTAALGLALRATGAKKRVFIVQFLKKGRYSELNALKNIKNITIEQFGRGCLVEKTPDLKDIVLAKRGLNRIKECIKSKKYDVVILDEVNIAAYLKLLALKDIIKVIKKSSKNIELVLTGRYAPKGLIRLADYVTEMKEIKHPFKKKIYARKGVEF